MSNYLVEILWLSHLSKFNDLVNQSLFFMEFSWPWSIKHHTFRQFKKKTTFSNNSKVVPPLLRVFPLAPVAHIFSFIPPKGICSWCFRNPERKESVIPYLLRLKSSYDDGGTAGSACLCTLLRVNSFRLAWGGFSKQQLRQLVGFTEEVGPFFPTSQVCYNSPRCIQVKGLKKSFLFPYLLILGPTPKDAAAVAATAARVDE